MKIRLVENYIFESGYCGYSMSNNAVTAYEEGRMPLSKWTKTTILNSIQQEYPQIYSKYGIKLKALTVSQLRDLCLSCTEWHHTSNYYNKTNFYELDNLEDLTDNDIPEPLKKEKPKTEIRKGTINYIEWTGTRNHPKATNKSLENVNIEERGSFYIVTDDSGNELLRKKIGSNGTYVTYNDDLERQQKERQEKEDRIIQNSSKQALELLDKFRRNGYESSWSGHLYAKGRKPSSWNYELGLDKFFKAGEQRLAFNPQTGGYNIETWNGEDWE